MSTVEPKIFVTPLLEAELTAAPTTEALAAWRRRTHSTADPSTVMGALLSQPGGISVEHEGVRATPRWFGVGEWAGERGVFALVEVATREANVAVLALERGYDRVLGVPAVRDAAGRIGEKLRLTLQELVTDGGLPEDQFFGLVSEFLQGLPSRLTAPRPPASLARWMLDHGAKELEGELCDRPLSRGSRLSVSLRVDDDTLQPAKDGLWFAPSIAVRVFGAKGKQKDASEQPVSLGLFGVDTEYEPAPSVERAAAARDVLRRWKAELSRRVGLLPPGEAKSLMPMDLPWPTSPLALAVQALRHGPAGLRPRAGALGELAARTRATLRELAGPEAAALGLPGLLCAYRVGDFTLALRRREDEEEGRLEDSLWLRRGAGPLLPLVVWVEEERRAYSADGDEPAYRLFAEWLRDALVASGSDRPLPDGVLPSDWLRLQDRDGEPLDHRVEEGAVAACSYEDIDDLLGAEDLAGCASGATALFRELVRELIDPDARFGQEVAQLGLP